MNKSLKNFLTLIIILPFLVGFGEANHSSIDVSLINLIATPEKYDGKLVRVIGISFLEFESNGLYLSKEDLENGVTKNALWIEINPQTVGKTEKELSKYNGKYILVEGVFIKDNTGHMGLKSGSIMNISRFEPWPLEIVKERLKKKG